MLVQTFISISLGLSQKKEIQKWLLRTSVQCIVVRDFGTYNDPLSDRKFRVCTCDTGFSKVDMYSGVRSFNALYVNTALLKFILFGTENQPSSLNIVSDGVLNSACKIMRAARFYNFDKRSICVPEADPHVREP